MSQIKTSRNAHKQYQSIDVNKDTVSVVSRLTQNNLSRAFGKLGNPLELVEEADQTRISPSKGFENAEPKAKSVSRTIAIKDRLKPKSHRGIFESSQLQRVVQSRTEEDR